MNEKAKSREFYENTADLLYFLAKRNIKILLTSAIGTKRSSVSMVEPKFWCYNSFVMLVSFLLLLL